MRRDLAIGAVLALVALMGALYQVAAATPSDATGAKRMPRLVCPLH
jgi:hypothetical protein